VERRIHDQGLEEARGLLRAEQGAAWHSQSSVLPGSAVTEDAVERYRELTKTVPDEKTGRVRRGAYTYEPEIEAERIRRGEALIRRVDPGPHEDANYFAMLAYQAASIELAFDDVAPRALFSKFLLGTVHEASVNAFCRRLDVEDYTIVVLHSGLVDFVYQAAKGVVEAMRPRRTTGEERGLVKTSTNLETIRAGLVDDPAPVDRLYRTMEAYFFDGYPRATSFETVPEEQHPPLALLVRLAERWIIGHEYGHGVAPSMVGAPDEVNVDKAEEYVADAHAMAATVLSADKLDAVPPQFPLGGAIFALACLDLLQRGLYLLLTGNEHWASGESDTHPAPRDRATALIDCFRQFFDVEYLEDHLFDLRFAPKTEIPKTHGFTRGYCDDACEYAKILQTVWRPTKARLLEDHRHQRPLHPMWQ
jgi:hypothetical protein